MAYYLLYRSDGTIAQSGTCKDEDLENQCPPGLSLLQITAPLSPAAERLSRVENGQIVSVGEVEQALDYRIRRMMEYPPLQDLADALFHQANGNEEPMAKYIARCAEVKAKIPKPD